VAFDEAGLVWNPILPAALPGFAGPRPSSGCSRSRGDNALRGQPRPLSAATRGRRGCRARSRARRSHGKSWRVDVKSAELVCPINPVVERVFSRWTTPIPWALRHHDRLRFTEPARLLPEITSKVLSQQRRQLERDRLITRTHHAEIPPRVEYQIGELGRRFTPRLRHSGPLVRPPPAGRTRRTPRLRRPDLRRRQTLSQSATGAVLDVNTSDLH
jgi:DNA-binding HxlR family transcriptional regulator